jgi:hypothetical protein
MTNARTYNQFHVSRPQTPGKRRVSIYLSWSYPGEAGRNLKEMDNRFSTMTELRRVEWPRWEGSEWSDPARFQQGIEGTLELFFRGWIPFQQLVRETTGHSVPVYQRVDQAGYFQPLDERVLADTDTLFVFGLDHQITNQSASSEEIEALRSFAAREGKVLVLGPHHDVGVSTDNEIRQMEYLHHGDQLVPRQQRFGSYINSITQALGIPVVSQYGLRPAIVPGSRNQVLPLVVNQDLDQKGWLKGVTALNFHKHMPHYAVTDASNKSVHVLGRQVIDTSNPHPFVQAGNTEMNNFLWVEPEGKRAADILFADSTLFSALFGASDGLKIFWRNLVK